MSNSQGWVIIYTILCNPAEDGLGLVLIKRIPNVPRYDGEFVNVLLCCFWTV